MNMQCIHRTIAIQDLGTDFLFFSPSPPEKIMFVTNNRTMVKSQNHLPEIPLPQHFDHIPILPVPFLLFFL